MDLYPWIVIAHVFFVIIAFGAHGASAFTILRLRTTTDRGQIGALLDLSAQALVAAGIALLVVIALGIWAAIMGGHFGRAWPWVSIVVLIIVAGSMTPLAAGPMREMRAVLGQGKDKSGAPLVPGTDAELDAAKAKLRPEATMAIGVLGLLLLVWLMEGKPF